MNQTFKPLLMIALLSIATFAMSCSKTGQPASNNTPSPVSSTASSSGGDFEGMIAMKMEGESQKQMEMTYFLKGRRTRIETKIPDAPEGSAVMLWDTDGGKITTLMPSRKMYMTMDMKAAAEGMKDVAKEMKKSQSEADAKFPKLTPTGKQEIIAGYTCEHWLMGDNEELDICVAKGLGYFGMGGQGRGGFDSWKNLAFGPKMLAEAAAHPEWVKFLEGGAFPLKLTARADGRVKMTMEATRVESKALDDSLFSIPSDYKELSIPTMPNLPSGKQ